MVILRWADNAAPHAAPIGPSARMHGQPRQACPPDCGFNLSSSSPLPCPPPLLPPSLPPVPLSAPPSLSALPAPPPAPTQPARILRPFSGDVRCATWNCQALFATDPARQQAKMANVQLILRSHDCVLVQETHSTQGVMSTWGGIPDARFFASHGTSHQAGVGIFISEQFINQFDPHPEWQEISPGRMAILRLRGPQGALDLCVIYMHTGASRRDRDGLRGSLAPALRPSNQALTMVAGDFNYVACARDRFSGESAQWTSHRDEAEESDFMHLVADPMGLHELRQDEPTHSSSRGRSRLDRIYWSSHPAHQLDKRISCAALAWAPHLSAHRAVSWSRLSTCRSTSSGTLPPLSTSAFHHLDWRRRVSLAWGEAVRQDQLSENPFRRLVLLKRAIREVTLRMEKERIPRQARTASERLDSTMAFIRAVEMLHLDRARELAKIYPDLTSFVDLSAPAPHELPGLHSLRDHAVSLAKDSLAADMREFQREQDNIPESVRLCRRKHFAARLARLRPGDTGSIQAVERPTGHIERDPAGIAAALADHWQRVFAGQPLDSGAVMQWLRDTLPPAALPRIHPRQWRLHRRDVDRAVRLSGNSAPGPDGIPYAAWRALGPLGVSALFAAAEALTESSAVDRLEQAYHDDHSNAGHAFNVGLLVCIPKSSSGALADGTPYYAPANTRPLALVDTSNRLIANAARFRWEPLLAAWVSPVQQGFLPGRSMLRNVFDIDEAAMTTALAHDDGALLLFDFSAAFPSIAHGFLFASLEHLGLPAYVLTFIRTLYNRTACRVALGGVTSEIFPLGAGIRQGCPLSPLLYVTVAESLLRALHDRLPLAVIRAFADDTALVTAALGRDLPAIQEVFGKFAAASNLHLNLPKTMLIPLGCRRPDAIRHDLVAGGDVWSSISIATWGRYLGFALGPDKGMHSWDKPLAKYVKLLNTWRWSEVGLHGAAVIYNVFVLPVLLFVAQLEDPPPAALEAESWGLRRVAPGPYRWILPSDLWRLRSGFGMSFRFRSLGWVATAAQARVLWSEATSTGGLSIAHRAARLEHALANAEYIGRRGLWSAWFEASPALVLQRTHDALQRRRLDPRRAEAALSGDAPQPWPRQLALRVKGGLQQWISHALELPPPGLAERRLRHKLQRWRLPGFPGRTARAVHRRFCLLRGCVAPRVHVAVLSSLFNRWTTRRRFQQDGTSRCLLGCGGDDALEHYLRCPEIRRAATTDLGIDCDPSDFWSCMMLAECPPRMTDGRSTWTLVALLHYAAYRTTNAIRQRAGPVLSQTEIRRAIHQALIEAVRGHPRSREVWRRAERPCS